jgi:hypothetical protein
MEPTKTMFRLADFFRELSTFSIFLSISSGRRSEAQVMIAVLFDSEKK